MSARNHCVILAKYTSIVKETKEVHPTFRVMRQSRKTYSLSLKYSSSLKLYALRFMTLILLFIPSTLPVDIWQSYHASIPLLYASIPLLYIQGCKAPMHDIENCCSLLYICLWLFKYTKNSAVFFYFIWLCHSKCRMNHIFIIGIYTGGL